MHPIFWALLVLFLFGALLRMDWVYYLAYVVGAIWLYSTWSVRRSLAHLKVTRLMLDRAFPGQAIAVTVEVENRSRLPVPWLLIEERVPLDLRDRAEYRIAASIGSRGQITHVYTLQAKRRGYYALGPLTLRAGDLFGFSESRWEEKVARYVTVYPQVLALPALGLPSRLPFGARATAQQMQEDPARLRGVRAYAPGDSLRRIHWKASAHTDALLVKQLQPAITLDLLVVLNFRREDYGVRFAASVSEWAATIAASVASAALAQRQPAGLLCNGLDAALALSAPAALDPPPATLPAAQSQGGVVGQPPLLTPRSGQAQQMAILSTLARLQLHDGAPPLAERLLAPLASVQWGTTIVVISPTVDEALIWVLHQSTRRGSSVVLLHCAQQAESLLWAARARRLGIEYHQPIWDKDLQAL
ncbi:MAG: DUF58 domain-containing protein [Caldilineaceae bacterium]